MELNGALPIDKPRGISSFGVVARLRGAMLRGLGVPKKELPRVGHTGTLDPFATGLLVICFGEATKLSQYYLGARKTYLATMKWGATTASGDDTDPVTETTAEIPTDLERVRVAARRFVGDYWQTPPMHSAIKRDGKRLYELAREGLEVEREPKLKRIHSFDVLTLADGVSTFRVECSSGTYVRTLAQDLARALGSLAHLTALRREGSGSISLEGALTLDAAEACVREWDSLPTWRGLPRMARDLFPTLEIPSELAQALLQGQQSGLDPFVRAKLAAGPREAALLHADRLVATIGHDDGARGPWRVQRVFKDEAAAASR